MGGLCVRDCADAEECGRAAVGASCRSGPSVAGDSEARVAAEALVDGWGPFAARRSRSRMAAFPEGGEIAEALPERLLPYTDEHLEEAYVFADEVAPEWATSRARVEGQLRGNAAAVRALGTMVDEERLVLGALGASLVNATDIEAELARAVDARVANGCFHVSSTFRFAIMCVEKKACALRTCVRCPGLPLRRPERRGPLGARREARPRPPTTRPDGE